MTVKLLTEHHFEFLSLKGCCTDSSESTLVKMPHCCKSHVTAHIILSDTICNRSQYVELSGVFSVGGLSDSNPSLNTIGSSSSSFSSFSGQGGPPVRRGNKMSAMQIRY